PGVVLDGADGKTMLGDLRPGAGEPGAQDETARDRTGDDRVKGDEMGLKLRGERGYTAWQLAESQRVTTLQALEKIADEAVQAMFAGAAALAYGRARVAAALAMLVRPDLNDFVLASDLAVVGQFKMRKD